MRRQSLSLFFISGLLAAGGVYGGSIVASAYGHQDQTRREISEDGVVTTIHSDGSTTISTDMPGYAPDEVIFKISATDGRRGVHRQQAQKIMQQHLQRIVQKHRFSKTAPVFANRAQGPLKHIFRAYLPAGVSLPAALKQLKADPAIKWAEPNYYYRCQSAPDDTYYGSTGSWGQEYMDMWGLHAINPENTWDKTQGDGIIVAVIDTGVDYNHEDLYRDSNDNSYLDIGEQYNVWVNVGEDINGNGLVDPCDFNGMDDDGNGFIDDIRGWNFVAASADPMDDHGHGSHCAGIIAAVGNNSKGIIGVAPLARVMIVKSLDSDGKGTATQLANGIMYAVNNGAHVLNNSWGGMGTSQTIADAVEYARSLNRVVVAAAGNDAVNAAFHFPANIRGVLSVAALNPSIKRASFSNFGSVVDFSAPGVDVLSLRAAGTDIYNDGENFVPVGDPNAKYYRANGTSMACPFASGVSALLLEQNPSLSETAVRRALAASAGPIGTTNVYMGTGRVDAEGALGVAEQVSDVNAAILQPQDDSEVLTTQQDLNIIGTANGDSYVLEFGEGYYPGTWVIVNTGTSVTQGLLGTLDLSDKQGLHQIRLTVSDGPRTAVEYMAFWSEPDLHPGWPVHLGGSLFKFHGLLLGGSYTATPADADFDGCDEIFIASSSHTFGLKGDGILLPGWPTEQLERLAYYSNGAFSGPSVADVDNNGNAEILWTLRDYRSGSSEVWCFNGKNLDGSNMSGFPQQAIDESSNATGSLFGLPFILADLDGNGTLEAIAAHTKGNNYNYYRISAYDCQGNRLFTHDFEDPNESVVGLIFGDLDGNNQNDIVAISRASYQNGPIYLHVLDLNGYEQPSYPVFLYDQVGTDTVAEEPFLADMDDDGDLEIILGISGGQSYIHCYQHNGTYVAGFPTQIGKTTQIFGYCMGDINGDDEGEIIVLANYRPVAGLYRVYVMRLNGTILPGWPFDLGEQPRGRPTIVDVDNDGQQDICFTTFSGSVYACSGDGELIPGFPKRMSFASTSGVSVGDVDGDGLFELVTANMLGRIYVWDLPTPAYWENSDWPMRHVNPRNTNVFGDRLLRRHDCELSGDYRVDWRDFSFLARNWLQSGDNLLPDFNHDGSVNFADLARCTRYWLEGIAP